MSVRDLTSGLVCGVPRSGTSILGRILGETVLCTHEIVTFLAGSSFEDSGLSREKLVNRGGQVQFPFWHHWATLYPFTTREMLRIIAGHTSLYLDKYPGYVDHLDAATKFCEFVVYCVRDPREVLLSQVVRYERADEPGFRPGIQPKEIELPWAREDLESAISSPRNWLGSHLAFKAWAARTKKKVLVVRYWRFQEDLGALASFLGVSFDSSRFQERKSSWAERWSDLNSRLPVAWVDEMRELGVPNLP